jgi:hypothetical protein
VSLETMKSSPIGKGALRLEGIAPGIVGGTLSQPRNFSAVDFRPFWDWPTHASP